PGSDSGSGAVIRLRRPPVGPPRGPRGMRVATDATSDMNAGMQSLGPVRFVVLAGALVGAAGCGTDCVVVDDNALELVVPEGTTVLLDGPSVEGCGPEEGVARRGEAWIRDADYRWFYGEIGESIGTDDMGRPVANEVRGTIKSGQP